MKRFWKKTEGFTLVELIVVIAILGILAGVGTVGYSGYIKKANMAADQQLIGEVKHALELAYYSRTIPTGETGVVVLSPNAVPSGFDVDSNVDKALESVFGAGYAGQLQLKYDGWKGGVASVYNSFKNSGYHGNQDQLMGDIQDLTNAVGTFLDHQGNDFMLFMGGNDWTAFQNKHSVDMTNRQNVANSTALFVAEMTNKKVSGESATTFVNSWCNINSPHTTRQDISATNFDDVGMGTLSNLAAHYARAEALAAYIDAQPAGTYTTLNMGNKADGTPYTSMKEWFADKGNVEGTDPDAVIASMDAVTTQFAMAMGGPGNYEAILEDYLKSQQAKDDAAAYLDMLGAINDHSDQLAKNLDQGSLYEGGAAHELLNGYLAAGEAMTADGASVPTGSVGIVIAAGNNGCVLSVVGAN